MKKATSAFIAAVAALALSGGAYAQAGGGTAGGGTAGAGSSSNGSTASPANQVNNSYGTPGSANSDSGMSAGARTSGLPNSTNNNANTGTSAPKSNNTLATPSVVSPRAPVNNRRAPRASDRVRRAMALHLTVRQAAVVVGSGLLFLYNLRCVSGILFARWRLTHAAPGRGRGLTIVEPPARRQTATYTFRSSVPASNRIASTRSLTPHTVCTNPRCRPPARHRATPAQTALRTQSSTCLPLKEPARCNIPLPVPTPQPGKPSANAATVRPPARRLRHRRPCQSNCR